MPLMTENMMVQYIKDNLGAGIVNIELSDDIIKRNLRVALMLSSDYFNYTDYVTLPVTQTTGSGGHVELSSIDPYGIPVILKVYPTTNVMNVDLCLTWIRINLHKHGYVANTTDDSLFKYVAKTCKS